MLFETNRLYVRHLKDEDLQALHELYADPAIMEFIRPPLTIEETKKIFDEQLLQYTREPGIGRYLVVEKTTDIFVGLFLLRINDNKEGVEIGYSFRKKDWGKGYATEIVTTGLNYVFTNTEFNCVYALTHFKNLNSKKVLEKCGFTYQYDVYEEGQESNLFLIEKKQEQN